MKLHAKKLHRRRLTLLEVLIAFTLILLSLVPLLSPHVTYYQMQRRLTEMVRTDHAVSLWYATLYEKMLRKEIAWEELPFDAPKPIVELDLSAHYVVSVADEKGGVYLLRIAVETEQKEEFIYYVVAERKSDEAEETAPDAA